MWERKRLKNNHFHIPDHEAVVQVQRENIQSGRKRDNKFEGKDGVRVMH